MAIGHMPSLYVIRVTTALPAGGADAAVVLTPLKTVQAVSVISGPADAKLKFGGTAQTAIPVVSTDPARNNLDLPSLYGSSVVGGSLVLELHGR